MTTTRHRAAAATVTHRTDGAELKGKAPGGMWWVAWRQHRSQIAVVLALIAVLIAALITFREAVIARFTAAGCDPGAHTCADGRISDLWRENGFGTWSPLLHAAVLLAPVVLGVFAGGPIFTREFSRGTHVFALTQSVSRRRWWTTKVVVMGVPLLAGLVALGLVTGWVDSTTGYTAHNGLNVSNFVVRGIIPAAHGLVAFAVAVAAGIVTRSTVASLVSGLIATGVLLAGMAIVQPHMLPATRQVTPFAAAIQVNASTSALAQDPDAAFRGSGYLDADGHEVNRSLFSCYQHASSAADEAVGITTDDLTPDSTGGTTGDGAVAIASPQVQQARNSAKYQKTHDRALIDCAHAQGVVASYTDYLPGSMLWPLRWIMTGIAAILAAAFLLLGAARLRTAVATR